MCIDQSSVLIKVSAMYGCKQHRCGFNGASSLDILLQILWVGRCWIGVSLLIRLLIVMSELDKQKVAFLHRLHNTVQPTLCNKALGAASTDRMVSDYDIMLEIVVQHLTPA